MECLNLKIIFVVSFRLVADFNSMWPSDAMWSKILQVVIKSTYGH